MTAHVGIDLAWGQKNWTGVAVVGHDGRLLASGRARTDDEIVEWIEAHAAEVGVVAIDAPLIVTNPTGRRRCESLIYAAFGRFDASPHSTNLGKPEFDPPRGAVLAERLGLPLDPSLRAGVAIEVYPHPAMVGLWELDLILKYKHKAKYAFDYRLGEFRRLLDLLEGVVELHVADLPRWGELREVAAAATKHGDLNAIEDEVDGIVCAWLAWLWAAGDEQLEVYGGIEDGYIVAPSVPIHDARPRSERMLPSACGAGASGPRSRVRFGAIGAEPDFALYGPSRNWALSATEAAALEAVLAEIRSG